MPDRLQAIAQDIAGSVRRLARLADRGWCESIMLAPTLLDDESIEPISCVVGFRRVTITGELVRVLFNVMDRESVIARKFHSLLVDAIGPSVEGVGKLAFQAVPEGLMVLLTSPEQSERRPGKVISLRPIDGDTRSTIAAMLQRGIRRERIAAQTGAPLQVVRIIEATL